MHKIGVPLLVFVAAMAAPAQQPAPPPAPGPTISVTTTEVALDMVVRDKKGKPVKNLKPGDVEVYEDGVKQQVVSFRLVPGHETTRKVEKDEQQPEQPKAGALPLREVNAFCIVFHNIDPVTRPHAIQIVKEFLRNDLPPETYVGLFTLNENLAPLHAFTKDREELIKTIDGMFTGKILDFNRASEALLTASPNMVSINSVVNNTTHTATVTQDITGGEVAPTVIVGADVDTSASANRIRGDQVRERSDFSNITGMHETDRIIHLIDQLAPLPGRKSVLLITTGLFTTGDPDRFQKIMTNANQHGITFYALDATEMSATNDQIQSGKNALGQQAAVSQQQTNLKASASQMRQNARAGDDIMNAVRTSDMQASLRQLSEGTGGFLIANTNDFHKSFMQVIDNLDAHYEAVYHPAAVKYDGKLRRIEVKLTKPNLQVDSRTGYFAMPDLKGSGPVTPAESTGLALLNAEKQPHAFDLHVTGYHFENGGANPLGSIVFAVPGAKLGAAADALHKVHKVDVSLFALIRDANGIVVDEYNVESPYWVPDASLPTLRAGALTYTHPVSLPAGHYTVETAVVDKEGGQATTSVTQIDNPAPPPGLGISSLVAVEEVEKAKDNANGDPFVFKGKHVVPMVEATVNPASKRYVYFVVYPDKTKTDKPKIKVEFKNGGQVFAQSTVDLPAAEPDGTIPMFVAAAAHPGNCELQITAVQGGESATERLEYAVRAQ